jgi:hypothetical protein
MPSLDKAFSDFLKALRGEQSYASLASKLGIAESTLYRLTNRRAPGRRTDLFKAPLGAPGQEPVFRPSSGRLHVLPLRHADHRFGQGHRGTFHLFRTRE